MDCPHCKTQIPADDIYAQHEHVLSVHQDQYNPVSFIKAFDAAGFLRKAQEVAEDNDLLYVASNGGEVSPIEE